METRQLRIKQHSVVFVDFGGAICCSRTRGRTEISISVSTLLNNTVRTTRHLPIYGFDNLDAHLFL